MGVASEDPIQGLSHLPLDADEKLERAWFQDSVAWLKSVPPGARTELLHRLAVGITEADPGLDLKARFRRMWTEAFAPKLFVEAGLPESTSLAHEMVRRIQRRVLPQLESRLDLCTALHAAELEQADADWIANLTDEAASEWAPLVGATPDDILIALRLLAVQAAAIGLSADVMELMPHRWEHDSPFYALVEKTVRVDPGCIEDYTALEDTVIECKLSSGVAHARLEEEGVSSDLVFKLDLVISQLDRMSTLLLLAQGKEDGRKFAAMLVQGLAVERGIHGLVRSSINRLARRIVEHTSRSGEHYIASSRVEWRTMGRGAVGAGAITAFTAIFKYALAAMPLAPLWTGIALSLNYTASFVLMQFLGWPLASKMPSMTAAALEQAMNKEDGSKAEVRLVAAICRTQSIVTAGNLLGAITTSLLIDLSFQWITGHAYLRPEAALHGVESMRLLGSLTVPFAAMTGCFLWISSLFAGLTVNWMARHNLSEAVRESRRVRQVLGVQRAIKLGALLDHHLSGVVGYTCLGLLLGLLPLVSVFAGVPVEVRHITLASASLTYDVRSLILSHQLPWIGTAWAVLGLAATGVCNFTVSFALGLWLAIRARRLDARGRKRLARALWNEFRSKPAKFFWQDELLPEESVHVGNTF